MAELVPVSFWWSRGRILREAFALAWEDRDTPEVRALIARAKASPRGVEAGALEAVQGLRYHADPPGEWLQRGRVTATEGGDCEDLAALLAVVLVCCGVRAWLVWLSQPLAARDHVTAAVWRSGEWWWLEPSVKGARPGESPYEAAKRTGLWVAL